MTARSEPFAEAANELGMKMDPAMSAVAAWFAEGLDGPRADAERSTERAAPARSDPLNAIARWCTAPATTQGSLDGLRIAVKDTIAIGGVPLTAGTRLLEDFIPSEDATVVQRLRGAGASVVAVTNMDQFGFGGGGDTCDYGIIRNPFDAQRTAGGSSGGSAAALSYPDVDATLGCDQAGSIRVPAAWCGVIGLKPTFGLVPYTRIIGSEPSVDHVGPMARDTATLARVLAAIAGRDGEDPRQAQPGIETDDYVGAVQDAPEHLKGIRIGVIDESVRTAEPPVAVAFERVMTEFGALGATVVRLPMPEHALAATIASGCYLEPMAVRFLSGGVSYGHRDGHWLEYAEALARYVLPYPDRLSLGLRGGLVAGLATRRSYPGYHYARAQQLRDRLTAVYDRALGDVHVLAEPTTPGLPHPVAPGMAPEQRARRGSSMFANTSATDMTGHPAISLPAASSGNLPVGIMLTGQRLGEAGLLRIARTIESACGWRPLS